MGKHKSNEMSRKDFIKKSCASLLTYGLLKESPSLLLNGQETKKQTSSGYRVLGRTGIKVAPVGIGASRTMEPTIVKTAIDKGINFIDTGRSYYNGQNEIMIGKVIKGIRKEVIIQSKMQINLKEKGEELKSAEVSKKIKNIMQSSLDESLKALQTDYIDIMLIHEADDINIINHKEVMGFFIMAKKSGKIRACGFSSHTNQINLLKSANETNFYDVIVVPYNHKGSYIHMLGGQYKEWDQPALEVELKKAQQNNTAIVAIKTCSAGPLSLDGKSEPSYKDALKWILNHSYVQTMAVAMLNMKEINEDIQAMI